MERKARIGNLAVRSELTPTANVQRPTPPYSVVQEVCEMLIGSSGIGALAGPPRSPPGARGRSPRPDHHLVAAPVAPPVIRSAGRTRACRGGVSLRAGATVPRVAQHRRGSPEPDRDLSPREGRRGFASQRTCRP